MIGEINHMNINYYIIVFIHINISISIPIPIPIHYLFIFTLNFTLTFHSIIVDIISSYSIILDIFIIIYKLNVY